MTHARQECMYAHLGPCEGPLRWRIPQYFKNGRDAEFCDKHGAEWNSLHLLGPRAYLGSELKSRKRQSTVQGKPVENRAK